MQNAKDAAYKQSNVERKVNWLIVGIFIAQTFLCIISAIVGSVWARSYAHDHKYLDCDSYFSCNPDMTGTIFLYSQTVHVCALLTAYISSRCSCCFLLETSVPAVLDVFGVADIGRASCRERGC